MSAQHTPGPWRLAGKATVRAGEHNWVATVHWQNREANARLIAAAPETAEKAMAFTDLVERYLRGGAESGLPEVSDVELAEALYALRSHIAQATGSAS